MQLDFCAAMRISPNPRICAFPIYLGGDGELLSARENELGLKSINRDSATARLGNVYAKLPEYNGPGPASIGGR
jgi:hypothetical protein